ncbi:hypothetical protein JG687_00004384 [Phytophthora cactorum]|uniref:sphingomyelin phosphodiesterase n=1 Tax=Phytophthora cactorum TaxID=29920 RepID=A0A8T1UTB2_9STRA|nr:hypothetical protein JG687_00004384 [Phytophthora cactorum]
MPTSSMASDIVASIRSDRSRPGSSVASRDANATVEEDHIQESEGLDPTPMTKLATVKLTDRSTYHGEVSDDGVPDGMGVLLSVFGTTYSGAIKKGKKHGEGVELQTNGAAYSGEFRDGVASGYGVYVGTLGDKYIGQWEDGARHGVGVSLDAEAVMMATHFNMDEPVLESGDATLSWEEHVQPHVLRAVLAEKAAIYNQEIARQRHIDAVVQEMTAIGKLSVLSYCYNRSHSALIEVSFATSLFASGLETFNTPEAIEAFEAKDERETAEFIGDQSDQMHEVNAVAGELKFAEAELTQRQKELRAEITAKRQELFLVAKYCALAETREAQRAMSKVQERLAVLSMNIFCRPEGIHSGQWFKTGDYKDLRVALLLRKMAKFDVVILQEMFEAGPRHKRFVREAYAMGFRYHCGSVWPRLLDSRLIDGGLLILSRYPIVERDQLAYSQGAGSDGICAKGVLYARIQLSPDLSDSLHVFTTHTQAGDNKKDYSIRLSQLQEMHRFIARTIRDDPGVPVLITGDFNLDARHDLVHDSQTGLAISTRCRESKVYQQLVADFERVVREARLNFAREAGKTVDADSSTNPLIIDLMKRCDITKLGDEIHPITNGDGHSLLFHKTDPLSLEKDGKCIDYMFFFSGVSDQTTASVSATTSTESTNGDGDDEDSAGVESVVSPRFRLTLVEKGTKVDHCAVNELTGDEHYSDEDDHSQQRLRWREDQLPITHLSDHYGLRANFLLETTGVERPDGSPVGMNESLASVLQLYFPQHAFAQQPRRLWKWKLAFALLAIVASAGGATLVLVRTVLNVVLR